MTNEQKKQILLDLIKLEEDGEIFNFTKTERSEFQAWVNELIAQQEKRGTETECSEATRIKAELLDNLSKESLMVVSTAYLYAKNYVNYGCDITKAWNTVVEQAAILERVRADAYAEAYDSFKKDSRWIPVSERLPEDYEEVIASVDHESVYSAVRYSKEFGWEWAAEASYDYWTDLKGVDAWMPLPEAYKPESEVKE